MTGTAVVVKEEQLTRSPVEPRLWLVDASDLQLGPGEWPDYVIVERKDDSRPLVFQRGSLFSWGRGYWSEAGGVERWLHVFSD